MEEKLRRQQLIARLPNITRLNGSSITGEERLDAERAFMRLFLDSEDKPDRSVHTDKHPDCAVMQSVPGTGHGVAQLVERRTRDPKDPRFKIQLCSYVSIPSDRSAHTDKHDDCAVMRLFLGLVGTH